MTLIKFASAAVLDARIARQGAGLVKDAHRHEFDYEPRPGFLYVRSRAISSRTNDNFDHFPAEEIKKAYRTFVGKPVFVNHHNDNHRRARGVIVDAALHEDFNPDGSEDTWAEVLMEVDAVRFPKLAQAILAGEIDRTSMGTDVQFSVCSVCNNKASTPLEYCQHIPKLKGKKVRRTTASGGREDVLVYEKCYGLGFFENSLLVEEPADPTAYFLGVDARGVEGMKVAASRRTAETDPEWQINGKPYRDGVWIEVEPDVWYRGADPSAGEIPSRMVVRREGDKWAWQAQVLTFIGAPHEDTGWQKSGTPRGTAKTLEQAQERAMKALTKDHEFFRRYQERMDAKAPTTASKREGLSLDWPMSAAELAVLMEAPNTQVDAPGVEYAFPGNRDLLSEEDEWYEKGVPAWRNTNHHPPTKAWASLHEAAIEVPEGYVFLRFDSHRAAEKFKRAEGADRGIYLASFDKPHLFAVPPEVWESYAEANRIGNGMKGITVLKRRPNLDDYMRPMFGSRTASRLAAERPTWTCPSCGNTQERERVGQKRKCDRCGWEPGDQVRTGLNETLAPAQVDTLRDESCPVCGENDSYDGDKCLVCGFIKPPDEFLDPDLEKAKQVDLRQDQQAETQTTQDGLEDPNQAEDAAVQEGAADPERPWLSKELPADGAAAGGDKPWEQKERPKADASESTEDEEDQGQPWKQKTRRKGARATTQKENSMRPALQALAEQQKTINGLQREVSALRGVVALITKAAGIENHPRIAALLKQAEDENPAQPEGWANPGGGSGAEAPAASTEEALGDLNSDDVTSQGTTSESDVEPDAKTSLEDTGTVLDEGLDLNEQDVTAPVAGTENLGEGQRGNAGTNRTETEVRVGDPNKPDVAFAETGWTANKQASEGRTIACLRLARLRVQAGIEAADSDDLTLGTSIAQSEASDEAIQAEIDTLAKVVQARKTAGQQPRQQTARNLVPRAASQAQRTVPSLSQEPQMPMQTVANGPSDDEFAFE